MMQERHPDWTDRKLRCPLYWQGHVRKEMRDFIQTHNVVGFVPLWVPEALGVNVTETCKNAGIELQWPPMTKTYVIVLYVRNITFEDHAQAPPRRSAVLEVVDE